MSVRRATEADVPQLVEMGLRFLQTVPSYQWIVPNAEVLAQTTRALLSQADRVVFVLEVYGVPVGMTGMVCFLHPVTGVKTVSELCWWVEPGYRGRGLSLLRAAELWAREQGAEAMLMIAPSPDVEAIYKRIGYTYVETTYLKRLSTLEKSDRIHYTQEVETVL
jgi:GNAT superfamily N-acetyltransferase